MRFRIPGRVIAFGVLLALLCLLPASTHVASARPYTWDQNNGPPPPNGDNDGVVVKAARISPTSVVRLSESTSGTASRWFIVRSELKGFAALVRLEYWRLIVR